MSVRPLPPAPNSATPTVTAYKSEEDLRVLKDWFYNFDAHHRQNDHRLRAVQRVRALSTRGRLPHGVEATSYLTSVLLDDTSNALNTNVLQLSYSMALIRFVNGLLDPFQQATHAIPLNQLAKTLNLPGFFVELRHMGTHEALPTLPILRIACNRALDWLYEYYWCKIDDDNEQRQNDNDDNENKHNTESEPPELGIKSQHESIVSQVKYRLGSTQLTNNLKAYKKIRKSSMDVVFASDDNSNEASRYWKAVKGIAKLVGMDKLVDIDMETSWNGTDLLAKVLIHHNYLIYNQDKIENKLKFNPLLIRLYKPLLDSLSLKFRAALFSAIVDEIKRYNVEEETRPLLKRVTRDLGFHLTHPFEVVQLLEWLDYLVEDLARDSTSTLDLSGQLKDLFNTNRTDNVEIFKKIATTLKKRCETFDDASQAEAASFLQLVTSSVELDKYVAPPSLEELLGKKRLASDPPTAQKKTRTDNFYLLEEHDDWTPAPFGYL